MARRKEEGREGGKEGRYAYIFPFLPGAQKVEGGTGVAGRKEGREQGRKEEEEKGGWLEGRKEGRKEGRTMCLYIFFPFLSSLPTYASLPFLYSLSFLLSSFPFPPRLPPSLPPSLLSCSGTEGSSEDAFSTIGNLVSSDAQGRM